MSQPFLQDIIASVLRSAGQSLKAAEIAGIIRRECLWFRPGDGEPPPGSQISARVKKHPDLFFKENGWISLKLINQPNRLLRLTWNTTGWQQPIRHDWRREDQGKSHVAFENQFGFGGEEWLFNPRYLLDGYQYGYIRGVKDLAPEVKLIPSAHLFTFNQTTRERFLAGKIYQLEVIKDNPSILRIAERLYARHLAAVEAEVQDAAADPAGLTAEGFLPNVRFRLTGDELFPELIPAPGLAGHQYNRFMPYIVDEALQAILDGALPEDGFVFNPGVAASTKDIERNNTWATRTVIRLHSDITLALENYLKPAFTRGQKNISIEKAAFGSNIADVVLKHGARELTILEVKTSGLARKNIREALGQLLDYACWHPELKIRRLVVVSPAPLSPREQKHFRQIASLIRVDLAYWQYLINPAKGEPAIKEIF